MELVKNYSKKPKQEINGEIVKVKEVELKGGVKAKYATLLTQDTNGNDVYISIADDNFGFKVGDVVRVKGNLKTTTITDENGQAKVNALGKTMVSHKLYKVELVK